MTHTSPDEDSFDDLFPPAQPQGARTATSQRWALPAVLLVVAAGALIAAFFINASASVAQPTVGGTAAPSTEAIAPAPSPSAAAAQAPSPMASVPAAPTARPVASIADAAWVRETAAVAGMSERAMAAYAGAAIDAASKYPGCNLGWNTLAAIGYVESAHGTHGGSSIGADGQVEPPIIGVALNGKGVQAVSDTDGGALDGDSEWDRAVGPMQFIPSTWQRYAQDANLDGVKDPQNIDDAVASAASYLCQSGGDLSQPANWIAAVNAYNPSVAYNNRVAQTADHYARLG